MWRGSIQQRDDIHASGFHDASTLQERDLHDDRHRLDLSLGSQYQFNGGCGRSAGSKNIINNEDAPMLVQRILM
jgi:hypothetical protein